MALADEVAIIAGIDPLHPPPAWCGAALHVSKWLREGWPREVIVVSAKTVMAKKRDGPPVSIRFFEHEIAREFARHSAPLPKVDAVQPVGMKTMEFLGENDSQSRSSRERPHRDPRRSVTAAIDRQLQRAYEREGRNGS